MRNVTLGKTGIVVPQNGFGALPIQRDDMEMSVEILRKAYDLGGSDIFIVPGAYVTCKVKGNMVALSDEIVKPCCLDA